MDSRSSNIAEAARLPSASVVIPTYDKAAYLDLTLASYLGQTSNNFELVIVNDGSRDDTELVVDRYRRRLEIKYIRQENRGRSAARNAALKRAEGDVIIFSDDDRIAPPTFVTEHTRQFALRPQDKYVLGWQMGVLTRWRPEIQHDPRVASFFLRNPELEEATRANGDLALVSASDVERNVGTVLKSFCAMEPWWNARGARVVELFGSDLSEFRLAWVMGTTGNMSVSRARLNEVGGFDEAFSGWGVEDNELCYRLSHAGTSAYVCREAINYHQIHPQAPTMLEEWDRNLQYFAGKYRTVDVSLFRLWAQGRDPAELDAISRDCAALQRDGRTHVVDELCRMYVAFATLEKLQRWW